MKNVFGPGDRFRGLQSLAYKRYSRSGVYHPKREMLPAGAIDSAHTSYGIMGCMGCNYLFLRPKGEGATSEKSQEMLESAVLLRVGLSKSSF